MQKITDNPHWWARAFWGTTVILAVLGIWLLAQLTWQLLTPPAAPASGPIAASAQNQGATVNIAGITRLNLFGSATVAQQNAASAPKTTLNLRLLGVSASSVPSRSAAIIEQRGSQDVYVVGDKLAGTNVAIDQIYADRVILNNNGRLETLELEGIGELSQGLSLTMANSSTTTSASVPTRPAVVREQVQSIDPEAVAEVRAAGANGILEFIRIQPVAEDGGLRGYRLSPGRNPELFNAAGFERGDIAVAINGANLNDISTAMRMQEELKSMSQVTITVIRGREYIDLKLAVPAQQ